MSQIIQSFGPQQNGTNTLLSTTFPLEIQAGQQGTMGPIQTIEVDNASNLTLSVFGDGVLIRTLTPYISRWNINTAFGWSQIVILANAAAIQVNDAVTVIAYDQVIPILFPPSFGVSAWGAGAVPNTLVNVNPGGTLLASNVQQIINFLTGVMTGQGPVINAGPNAGYRFLDRDGVGGDYFTWYSTASQARLFSSVLNNDIITVGEAGNTLFAGRVESNNTGASNKPLLNFVPITLHTHETFALTHDGAWHAHTMPAAVPTSAVAVAMTVSISASANFQTIDIGYDNGNAELTLDAGTLANGPVVFTGIVLPILNANPQTFYYRSSAAGAISLVVNYQGYYEPS